MRWMLAAVLAGGLAALAGCGGPPEAEVSGTVLIDGKPLKEGEILFEETDRSKTPAAGKIEDGKYALKVLAGSKLVRITASRPTAKPDPVMGAAAREPLIAREFNTETTLKVELKPGKHEDVDFKVKAIP